MKSSLKIQSLLAAAILIALALSPSLQARQGATDPIPGTSKGAVNTGGGGGGGGKSSAPTPTPIVLPPAPPPSSFVAQTLTFTPVSPVNGVDPVCTGDYHIDPYYPTLSLVTVNVETTSVNLPDGSAIYVAINGTGGTIYPFTSNIIFITGQLGLTTYSAYITPGTVITSVTISDATGRVIASGR